MMFRWNFAFLPPVGLLRIGAVAAGLLSAGAALADVTVTYTYDALGRLVEVTYADGAKVTNSYDPADNRTGIAVTGLSGGFTVEAPTAPAVKGGNLVFTVRRSGLLGQAQSIDVATVPAGGSATAGADYNALATTTLTFAIGVDSLPVSVATIDDHDVDGGVETVQLQLSNATPPDGSTIDIATALGSITDNDHAATLAIASVSPAIEGNPVSFTVTRSGDTSVLAG